MKRFLIFAGLLLTLTFCVSAETQGILFKIRRIGDADSQAQVNRSPMNIYIEAIFDPATSCIEVVGNESIECEVFLYDTSGWMVGYSSTLNATFMVIPNNIYIIRIQGAGWYAESEVICN